MLSMIIISSGALAIAIIGCAVIWGMDARRANEIERPVAPARHALGAAASAQRLGPVTAPVAVPVAIPVSSEGRPDVAL